MVLGECISLSRTCVFAYFVIMATFGKLEEFNPDTTLWTEYHERMEHFFSANKIEQDKLKCDIFLSSCGSSCYKLIKTLSSPTPTKTLKFADIIKLLSDYHCPQPSAIVQRYKFNTCHRKSGETFSSFLTRLRELSEFCDFGISLEDMLRDRIVCGIGDESIQRRLLGEKNLNLEKAKTLAISMETAAKHTMELKHEVGINAVHSHSSPNSGFSASRGEKGTRQCYRCGGSHNPAKCKFREADCHNCGKRGHIARVCKSPPTSVKKGKASSASDGRKNARKARNNFVSADDHSDQTQGDTYELFTIINHVGSQPAPLLEELSIDGRRVKMEVDTGASVTIVNEETYNNVLKVKPLRKSTVRLKTYTSELIPVMGELDVTVLFRQQEKELRLIVVAGKGPNLVGRDWLEEFNYAIGNIKQLSHTVADTDLDHVLLEHADVFKEGIGHMKDMEVKIRISDDATPKFCKPRPVPYALKANLEKELDRLIDEGILEPVQFSEWASPIVTVIKSDSSLRVCGDYKVSVNKFCQQDVYPIPKPADLFAKLAGGVLFSKLDLSSAYQQLQLDDASKVLTTINTHKGLFRYTRLPFGISSAPAIFQRTMESLLRHLPMVVVYYDDILVSGKNREESMKNLRAVLKCLLEAGLRLKPGKCVFLQPEVKYLGYSISAEGLKPTEDKLEAIAKVPAPTTVSELRTFLGLLNFYGKFLPRLSTVLAPLHELLKKECSWMWGPKQSKAFNEAKDLLQSNNLLVHYDPDKQLILTCDASPVGVGAVLSHRVGRDDKPIAFASRTLAIAEKKYSQLEKEGLAVVFAVKKFHEYVYGRHFMIQSDHKPLEGLLHQDKAIPVLASSRIQRWALTLQAYNYSFEYRPGKSIDHADALSRLPLPTVQAEPPVPGDTVMLLETLEKFPVTAREIGMWTEKDRTLSRVKKYLLYGWPDKADFKKLDEDVAHIQPYFSRRDELSLQGECILWGSRVVVPPPGRNRVLEELHCAHPGISRMKALARGLVWWPKLDQELENTVKSCRKCMENQRAPTPAPLNPWTYPESPWCRIHIDFAGPVYGFMLLIIVDAHSKWIDVHKMTTTTASATIECLRQTFASQGLPESLVSDNAAVFVGEEFQDFMSNNGIHHITSAPYHPATNGLAERAVQTVKSSLKKITEGSLQTRISRFLYQYRMTPQSTTNKSPAELLMKRKFRSRLSMLYPDLSKAVRDKQETQKHYHDRSVKDRQFVVGDSVYVKNFSTGPRWLSGTVVEKSGPVSYVVKLEDNKLARRHVDHMQRQYVELDDDTPDPVIPPIQPLPPLPPAETITPRIAREVPPVSDESSDGSTSNNDVPISDLPVEPTISAAEPAAPPESVRRSQRCRRAPVKLNI